MAAIRILSAAIFATSMALTAAAQAQSAPAASMPMAGASTPQDCAKPMPKHDHAAEKGMPAGKSGAMPCAPSNAATAAKKAPTDDHTQFHKSS